MSCLGSLPVIGFPIERLFPLLFDGGSGCLVMQLRIEIVCFCRSLNVLN